MTSTERPSLEEFTEAARAWLDANAERRGQREELAYGVGSDDVAVFQTLTHEEEQVLIDEILDWQRRKVDAGFGALTWPVEHGGRGLPRSYEAAFRAVEREYLTPKGHEAVGISMNIETPTILTLGNAEQKARTLTNRRAAEGMKADGVPGPEGSIGKLAFTNELQQLTKVASLVLGARLQADTGEWGTSAWHEQVTGTPGMRIAGGTDEIQRNTVAERVLGLPREPRPT